MMAKRGACLAFLMLLVSVMVAAKDDKMPFSWSDCGVQLNKEIHYQSASISPNTAVNGGQLAINVQATIASEIIYDADTRLMVWKDGVIFLDVYIDKLCAILSNTKALKCPLEAGVVSFTYNFGEIPTLVSGEYVIQVKSYDGSVGLTDSTEIGCIQFNGTYQGVSGNYPDDKCLYKSSFAVQLNGDAHYTNSILSRKTGDLIQIGPMGNLTSTSGPFGYGKFVGYFLASDDLGGPVDSTAYTWALNGTLDSRDKTDMGITDQYSGTFYVLYNSVVNFQGYFNWTFMYSPTGNEQGVTGSMWLDPKYYIADQFTWPVIVGNLGPFDLEMLDNGNFIVQGNHFFCTCGVDACGVCNGNGGSCGLGSPVDNSDWWGPRKIAAVVCGIIAALLLAVVIELSRRIRRRQSRIPIDDTDLLDHPEKPDYGTMAIDDAIREGERVV